MPTKARLPQLNYSSLASRTRKKRPSGFGLLVFLLLILGVLAIVFRDRLSWYANLLLAEPAKVAHSTPNAGNPSLPATLSKTKSNSKPGLAEAGLPSTSASVTTSERTMLPPLSVEVISAGGSHRTLHSHNAPVQINLDPKPATPPQQPEPVAPAGTPVNAAEHRGEAPEVVYRPVEPTYPRLAEQMKVQGAVVLRVNIDKAGNIENIQVLAGPDILAAAAQEAVRKWRFRPHYKNGQPIETEARVVVHFVISTQ